MDPCMDDALAAAAAIAISDQRLLLLPGHARGHLFPGTSMWTTPSHTLHSARSSKHQTLPKKEVKITLWDWLTVHRCADKIWGKALCQVNALVPPIGLRAAPVQDHQLRRGSKVKVKRLEEQLISPCANLAISAGWKAVIAVSPDHISREKSEPWSCAYHDASRAGVSG
jgi:hypothetical protein